MKRGFTMIELIFVIVILGILAAVAIPKLMATRDDAVAAVNKVKLVMQDFSSYYIAQTEFTSDFKKMTNVLLPIRYKGEICANFEYNSANTIILRRNHKKVCDHMWETGKLSDLQDTLFADGIIIVD